METAAMMEKAVMEKGLIRGRDRSAR